MRYFFVVCMVLILGACSGGSSGDSGSPDSGSAVDAFAEQDFDLVESGTNDFVLLWSQSQGTSYVVSPVAAYYSASSDWGNAYLMQADRGEGMAWYKVVSDSNGNLTAAWVIQYGLRRELYVSRFNNGSMDWTSTLMLANNLYQHPAHNDPVMVAGDDGEVTVGWFVVCS